MRLLLGLLAWLPAALSYALAGVASILIYHVFRYRRATVRENLQQAFPDYSKARLLQIEKASYRHLCNLGVEIIRSSRMPREEFVERVSCVNLELLETVTQNFEKQGLLLLVHQGNWEWALHAAMAGLPVPIDPVYKRLHSPFWEQFIKASRSRFGATPMAIDDVGRAMIRGRKYQRLVGMLADQAGPRYGGYWTEFLNRPATFYRGADKLAKALELPVVFVQCRLLSRGYYEVSFHELSLPPHRDDSEAILEDYVQMAEQMIAAQPETYLWTNRRWKKRPPDSHEQS
ncbi:MAG: KDO2-lipid IV(A) lauroyltransferase [Halieaceae bacterium]|jgi:KDO2-lipid IV(A) lauroyltransferase